MTTNLPMRLEQSGITVSVTVDVRQLEDKTIYNLAANYYKRLCCF